MKIALSPLNQRQSRSTAAFLLAAFVIVLSTAGGASAARLHALCRKDGKIESLPGATCKKGGRAVTVSSLRGKRGIRGPRGRSGKPGAQGVAGAPGDPGPGGSAGAIGPSGDAGDAGVSGDKGPTGYNALEIPSGLTLSRLGGVITVHNRIRRVHNFEAILDMPLDREHIIFDRESLGGCGQNLSCLVDHQKNRTAQNNTAVDVCPGSASNPIALPGYLCIYPTTFDSNLYADPIPPSGSRFGFVIGTGDGSSFGGSQRSLVYVWTYTAP